MHTPKAAFALLILFALSGVHSQGLSDREQSAASAASQGKDSARTEVAANGGATDAALVQKTFAWASL